METSYLKTLELDKIIARAAEGCVCKEAREMLLATQPQCDPDEVRYALEQTDAINTLLIKNGSPRFGGVENVSQLAARAVKVAYFNGRAVDGGWCTAQFSESFKLVWCFGARRSAYRRSVLCAGTAAGPGTADLQRHSGTGCMADTASHTLNDLRKKNPRNGEQHP